MPTLAYYGLDKNMIEDYKPRAIEDITEGSPNPAQASLIRTPRRYVPTPIAQKERAMGIIIVSSAPIELLANCELKTGEEDTEKIAHVYGSVPAMRQPYTPTTTHQAPIGAPRRYEPPKPAPCQRGKKHLYLVADEQKKEEV